MALRRGEVGETRGGDAREMDGVGRSYNSSGSPLEFRNAEDDLYEGLCIRIGGGGGFALGASKRYATAVLIVV